VQELVPEHAPLHPPKVEPLVALAVRVTEVPLAKLALHVLPQLIPAGLLVTVPEPLPASVTLSCGEEGDGGGFSPGGLLEVVEVPPPQPASASAKLNSKIVLRKLGTVFMRDLPS
jgi:hypothetical protein